MRPSTSLHLTLAIGLLMAATAHAAPPRFASPFFSYASGFDARAVTIADANGDGHSDVLMVNATGLEVRLGVGDGTLGDPASQPIGLGRFVVTGDLDLVVTAERANAVSVLLGDGVGGFGPRTDVATGNFPGPIAAGDLDHDGDLDVVVADRLSSTLTRLLGAGAGLLVADGAVPVPGWPGSLARALSRRGSHSRWADGRSRWPWGT